VSHASQATLARQSPGVWFLIIAGIAFALRLIHLIQLRHDAPLFSSSHMDALYLERVQAAAGGDSESVEQDLVIAAYRETIARAGLRRGSPQSGPGLPWQTGAGGRGDRACRHLESDLPAIAACEKRRPWRQTPRGRRAAPFPESPGSRRPEIVRLTPA